MQLGKVYKHQQEHFNKENIMPKKTAKVKLAEGKASKAKIKAGTTKKARVKKAVSKKTPSARVRRAVSKKAPSARVPAPKAALPTARIPTGEETATTKIPLGEALDLAPPFIGANIYDESIGYGTALPGEAGQVAVERIKAERASRRSRVSR